MNRDFSVSPALRRLGGAAALALMAALMAALTAALAGCGQKGPLTLPTATAASQPAR